MYAYTMKYNKIHQQLCTSSKKGGDQLSPMVTCRLRNSYGLSEARFRFCRNRDDSTQPNKLKKNLNLLSILPAEKDRNLLNFRLFNKKYPENVFENLLQKWTI